MAIKFYKNPQKIPHQWKLHSPLCCWSLLEFHVSEENDQMIFYLRTLQITFYHCQYNFQHWSHISSVHQPKCVVFDVGAGNIYLVSITGTRSSREREKEVWRCWQRASQFLFGHLGNGVCKNLGCESRLPNLNTESVLAFIEALFTIAPNWKQVKYPSTGE